MVSKLTKGLVTLVALLLFGCSMQRDGDDNVPGGGIHKAPGCSPSFTPANPKPNVCYIEVVAPTMNPPAPGQANPPTVKLAKLGNVRVVWIPPNGFEFRKGSIALKPGVSDDGELILDCPGPNEFSCHASRGVRHIWVWKNTPGGKSYDYAIDVYVLGAPDDAKPAFHVDPTLVNQ